MKAMSPLAPPLPATVEHDSARVHCDTRQEPAVISVIARSDEYGERHFVLWCSLRGIDACDEHCLRRRRAGPDSQSME